ncbi:MAG TPA: RsmG family class I SAM-dependent methyltransferase, partial [Geminicoccaceae bacterium]|nr:RsmG family class I SAM-dependent methyltransferase [Geminicoccaceae bacterium]
YPHVADRPGPLVDLGSGAGFPGLVLAILGAPDVHLIESDSRKAQFLREAARITGTPLTVHAERIEEVAPFPAGVITARALAPLPRLLDLAAPFLGPDTLCLFLKGIGVLDELKNVCHDWQTTHEVLPSRADPSGAVLKLERIRRVGHG